MMFARSRTWPATSLSPRQALRDCPYTPSTLAAVGMRPSLPRGSADEITQNLLTLAEGTLYFNTNLGAVASLSADDGHIRWLTTYPERKGATTTRICSAISTRAFIRGTLYVAPTDSPQILAIDAMTGITRWATSRARRRCPFTGRSRRESDRRRQTIMVARR